MKLVNFKAEMAFEDLHQEERNESMSYRKFSVSHVRSYLRTKKSNISRSRHSSVICSSMSLFDGFENQETYKSGYPLSFSPDKKNENILCGMDSKFVIKSSGSYTMNQDCDKPVKRHLRNSLSTSIEEERSGDFEAGCRSKNWKAIPAHTSYKQDAVDLDKTLADASAKSGARSFNHQNLWHQSLMNLRKKRSRSRILSDGWFSIRKKSSPDESTGGQKTASPFQRWNKSRKRELTKTDDLKTLLKDKARTQAFRKFLELEFNEENLDFWLDVEAYKKCSKKKQIKLSQIIFDRYIEVCSPNEINIDSSTRKMTKERMLSPDLSTFDLAQNTVFDLMERDPYRRFNNAHQHRDVKC